MATIISGTLHGTDTVDGGKEMTLTLPIGAYEYSVKASGGGKLGFRIDIYTPALLGETGGSAGWSVIEKKSKIASGTTLRGAFTLKTTPLSSSVMASVREVRITFSRALLTKGVDYKLTLRPA